jgi:hypothetical protein
MSMNRKTRASGQALRGMSFVEMLVSIAILLVGMEGFTLLFLSSWRQNGYIFETGVASAAAARSVNEIVSDIRRVRQADNGDYPVESGDDFDLTVYIDIDNDGVTERAHYYLDSGVIKIGVTEPAATQPISYPVGDQTVTNLAGNVDNEPTEPLFFYYDDQYPTVTTPLSTPITVEDVRLVRVRVVINVDPDKAPEDTNIESFAELRNLRD